MSDPDQAVTLSNGTSHELPGQAWEYDAAAVDDQPAADFDGTYTSLGFIGATLRRTAWFWCLLAVIGLLIGSAVYAEFPPSYQASTTILLNEEPNQDPATAIATDAVLAQSTGVATQVVRELGLRQTPASLIAATSVTVVTNQVLLITVSAPASGDAVRRASALATAFLQLRADYLRSQQQLLKTQVDQQVSEAKKQLASLTDQIDRVEAEPASSAQRASLNKLTAADAAQEGIVSNQLATLAAAQTSMTTAVTGTQVLNKASAVHHSRIKRAALYVGGGLIAGLAVGIGIVLIWALTTDRLRRRDDIAYAVGAPVRLSVGRLRPARWSLARFARTRSARRSARDTARVAAHLRAHLPPRPDRPAPEAVPGTGPVLGGGSGASAGLGPGAGPGAGALAVVAVDNVRAVAPAVVSMALTCAREGKRVLVADLAGGTVAGLLGSGAPGVRMVAVNGTRLVVVVPERDDVTPAGPVGARSPNPSSPSASLAASSEPAPVPSSPASPSQTLRDAYADADVLLTLTTLDPALGGDHLATWARDAVAIVTAGKSSASRIHAVGEMVRLAGMRLVSVALIGADKRDESIVAARVPDQTASALGWHG